MGYVSQGCVQSIVRLRPVSSSAARGNLAPASDQITSEPATHTVLTGSRTTCFHSAMTRMNAHRMGLRQQRKKFGLGPINAYKLHGSLVALVLLA